MKSLTLYEKIANPLAAIDSLGKWICDSGDMFSNLTPPQGKMIAWYCMSNQVDPFTFKRDNHISAKGEIIPKTNAATARFIDAGGDIIWHSGLMDRKKAQATFVWKGREYGPWTITDEDAHVDSHLPKYEWTTGQNGRKKKRVVGEYMKDTWRKDPAGMLRMALKRKAITMLAPELLCPQRATPPPVQPEPAESEDPVETHMEEVPPENEVPSGEEILSQIKNHFGVNMLPMLDKYAQHRKWVDPGEPFAAVPEKKLQDIWMHSEMFDNAIQKFAENLRKGNGDG